MKTISFICNWGGGDFCGIHTASSDQIITSGITSVFHNCQQTKCKWLNLNRNLFRINTEDV